jgi:acyl-CoA reductase-like NAD-dependent aldehyde dehydrogenase
MTALKPSYPLYLANEAKSPNQDLEVTDKYTGKVVTRVAQADAATIDAGIAACVAAAEPMAAMASYERQAVLAHCVTRFQERFEELALALCVEAGKPIKDSRGEVTRLIDTFRIAAEESVRMTGEVQPLDISPRAKGYQGMWKRVPIGPCSFISPFNFPLNLAAHKIAPALAVGCPFVMKPASRTPLGAIIIGEVLAETNLPKGAFSILPAHRDGADLFTTDDRLKLLSFTGSPEVGWDLKARAGKKKVILELGGNAAVIVEPDADIVAAASKCVTGGFTYSGQSCISVQRIFVRASAFNEFSSNLVAGVQKLRCGDPLDETTDCGPLIRESDAIRIEEWINESLGGGAKLLCGGRRTGSFVEPAVLTSTRGTDKVNAEEVFGPLVVIEPYADFVEAVDRVNDSRYGLQAGVFTSDRRKIEYAFEHLDVGGVIVNDVPTFRGDAMPYGGVKDSGLGREGVRYAMAEMSEMRLLVV